MIDFTELDKFTREEIFPPVSADGGDIRLISLEGTSAVFGAYAECAVCPACNDDYIWWISSKIRDRFGIEFEVKLEKHPSYYGS